LCIPLIPGRAQWPCQPMQRSFDVPLQRGAHPTRDDGMCAMEMVAWLKGEPHSDEPGCACPVLGAFVRACNDAMSDAQRNRFLRPLVPILVDTRATAAVERARGQAAIDGLVRTLLPMWLQHKRRRAEAKLLSELPPLERLEDTRAALRAIEHFVGDQHATRWVLQRAIEGTPAPRYVAGIVQVLRAMNDTAAWSSAVALVERLVAIRATDQAAPATPAFADGAAS
jgi:hypothetical protein